MIISQNLPNISNTELSEIEILGRGGFGTVYRAFCPALCRHLAIKVLSAEHAFDETRRQRFLREAQALSRINHPNLVQIYSYGLTKDGLPYYAMELLEGKTLSQTVEDKDLTLEQLIEVFKGIVRGVEVIHSFELIHRDLTPNNCMVLENNNGVKIIDFGLIKNIAATAAGQKLTTTNQILGSYAYMSPEACTGNATDTRSDIYSLGCILYFIMTGKPPYTSHTAEQQLLNHVFGEITPVHLERTDRRRFPEIDKVIAKCLAKSPALRYQSAQELQFDLEAQELLVSGPRARSPRFLWTMLLVPFMVIVIALACAIKKHNPQVVTNSISKALPKQAVILSSEILTQSLGGADAQLKASDIGYQGFGTIREAVLSGKLDSVERIQAEKELKNYQSTIASKAEQLAKIIAESKPQLSISEAETLIKCAQKSWYVGAEQQHLDLNIAIGENLGDDPRFEPYRAKIAKLSVECLSREGSHGDNLRRCMQIAAKLKDSQRRAEINIRLALITRREKNPLYNLLREQVASWSSQAQLKEIEPYLNELRALTATNGATEIAQNKVTEKLLESIIRIDKKQKNNVQLGCDLWLLYEANPKKPDSLLEESVRCFETDGFRDPRCLLPLLVLASKRLDFARLPVGQARRAAKLQDMEQDAEHLLSNVRLCLDLNSDAPLEYHYLYRLVCADRYLFIGDYKKELEQLEALRLGMLPKITDRKELIAENVRLSLRILNCLVKLQRNERIPEEAGRLCRVAKEEEEEEEASLTSSAKLLEIVRLLDTHQYYEALTAIDSALKITPPPKRGIFSAQAALHSAQRGQVDSKRR